MDLRIQHVSLVINKKNVFLLNVKDILRRFCLDFGHRYCLDIFFLI